MPIFTTKITGSTDAGTVEFSGSLFQAAGFISAMGFGNASVVNVEATTPVNYNSVLYGPITIDADGTLTISTNSNVKIKDFDDA